MSHVAAILKATDIAVTVDWYRSVGFDVRRSEPTLCEVARDGLALQFLVGETPWAGSPTLTGSFYVHVPDVDAVAHALRGSVTAAWGVEDREWGSRELVLQDPDGYFVTFTSANRLARLRDTRGRSAIDMQPIEASGSALFSCRGPGSRARAAESDALIP